MVGEGDGFPEGLLVGMDEGIEVGMEDGIEVGLIEEMRDKK